MFELHRKEPATQEHKQGENIRKDIHIRAYTYQASNTHYSARNTIVNPNHTNLTDEYLSLRRNSC